MSLKATDMPQNNFVLKPFASIVAYKLIHDYDKQVSSDNVSRINKVFWEQLLHNNNRLITVSGNLKSGAYCIYELNMNIDMHNRGGKIVSIGNCRMSRLLCILVEHI